MECFLYTWGVYTLYQNSVSSSYTRWGELMAGRADEGGGTYTGDGAPRALFGKCSSPFKASSYCGPGASHSQTPE